MNITKILYNSQIYNYCYEFGSRYLGVASKNSDYDFYCLKKHFDIIKYNLIKLGFLYKNSYYLRHSYEFEKEDIKIHLVVCQTKKELECWKITCQLLKRGIPKEILKNKTYRIQFFEENLKILKYFYATEEDMQKIVDANEKLVKELKDVKD